MDFLSLPSIVIIYLSLNTLAFIVFTGDKVRAKIMIGRISENALLFVAALGPFGALTAMTGFRHKTRHVKFLIVPAFAILHVVLILILWLRLS
jgi:uncharacterized membrane protein YsdA (DUF1294 family)